MSTDRDERTALLAAYQAEEARADDGGGKARQARQRKLGRMTARDRIAVLFDPGSGQELQRHRSHGNGDERTPGDGVVTMVGTVSGRRVAAFAHEATVKRGALGIDGAQKVVRLYELALRVGMPIVGLHDSDGVRIDEGPEAIRGYGEIIRACVDASGAVPQVAVVCGLCVGAAAYSAALADAVIMVDEWAFMFITGSKVTRTVTGEDTPVEELGGAAMHASVSGAAHRVAKDDGAAIALARELLSYLPSHAHGAVPVVVDPDPPDRPTPELWDLIPQSRRKAYDVAQVVRALVDGGKSWEWAPSFAKNLWCGLARIGGHAVGVVASNPKHRGGALDVAASRKGARFVQLCSAYGLPVVTLADVPGFVPGKAQEQGGILLHGAQLLSAYGAADVPLISVVLGKSYGGASVLSYTGDVVLALPTARYDVVGVDAALAILAHAEGLSETEIAERRATIVSTRDRAHAAAEAGLVDRVVLPERLRAQLVATLSALHGLKRNRAARRRLNPPT